MRRVEEGYRFRFRRLLARVGPKRLEFGVELLLSRARERAAASGMPLPEALESLYEETRVRVEKRVRVTGACFVPPPAWEGGPRFLCDAGLGGLARWLRAAGYEAEAARAGGAALVPVARADGRVLATGDTRVLKLRDVLSGSLPVAWVPSSADTLRQLAIVLRDLQLGLAEPRCMSCGGVLDPVDKEAVLDRIPPRTRAWKDEYFLCGRCGRLFWQGTHWERIGQALGAAC